MKAVIVGFRVTEENAIYYKKVDLSNRNLETNELEWYMGLALKNAADKGADFVSVRFIRTESGRIILEGKEWDNIFDLARHIRRELTPKAYADLLKRLAGDETLPPKGFYSGPEAAMNEGLCEVDQSVGEMNAFHARHKRSGVDFLPACRVCQAKKPPGITLDDSRKEEP